jgi:FkbM family methyltransferase
MFDGIIAAIRPFHFRGKYRLLNPFAPNKGMRSASVFGLQFQLDLSDWIQRNIYLGTYEPHETELVAAFLKPGMTVVDIGANVGYYTALASSKVGSEGRIFAIEPDPGAFAQLQTLIANNHLSARAFNAGLGEKNGEELLYRSPDSRNNTPTMIKHGGLSSNVKVTTRKLDDCLVEWQVAHVDLLKIDVEGWEPRIFEGASCALASGRIDAILCEFNDYWLRAGGSSPEALWKTLKDVGFHPTRDVDVNRLSSDGLVNCLFVRRT